MTGPGNSARSGSLSESPTGQQLCGKCDKTTGKDVATCHFCEKLFHGNCCETPLTSQRLRSGLFANPSCLFVCVECRKPSGLVGLLESLSEENKKLSDRISALEHQLSLPQRQSADLNFSTAYEAVEEYFERKEKKNNVVVHFLPKDDTQGEQGDISRVKDLIRETSGDPDSVERVFRLGKARQDGNPRLLKVILKDTWTKRRLITGQQRLRDAHADLNVQNARFFIRDDLTTRQREVDKLLRESLRDFAVQKPRKTLVDS